MTTNPNRGIKEIMDTVTLLDKQHQFLDHHAQHKRPESLNPSNGDEAERTFKMDETTEPSHRQRETG